MLYALGLVDEDNDDNNNNNDVNNNIVEHAMAHRRAFSPQPQPPSSSAMAEAMGLLEEPNHVDDNDQVFADELEAALLGPLFPSSDASVNAAKVARRKKKRPAASDGSTAAAAPTGMAKARKAHAAAKDAPADRRRSTVQHLNTAEVTAAMLQSMDNATRAPPKKKRGGGAPAAKGKTSATATTSKKNEGQMGRLRRRMAEKNRRSEAQNDAYMRSLLAHRQPRGTAVSSLDVSALAADSAIAAPPARPELGVLDIPYSVAEAPRHSGEPFAVTSLRLRMEQATLARELLEQHKALRDAVSCLPGEVSRLVVAKLDESDRTSKQMCAIAAQMQAYCEERARLLLQHVMLARTGWNIHTGVIAATVAVTATATPTPASSAPAIAPATGVSAPPPPPIGSFSAVRAVPPLAVMDTVRADNLFDPQYKTFAATPQALCRR